MQQDFLCEMALQKAKENEIEIEKLRLQKELNDKLVISEKVKENDQTNQYKKVTKIPQWGKNEDFMIFKPKLLLWDKHTNLNPAQKLLEFTMALMNEPKALLLDEPTAGINPTLINGLIDRLQRANEELGITLCVIEHNMRVIMNLASDIYCLANGRMLASGAPEELQNDQRVIDAYLGGH